ncbi:carbon-nitrogen hydrolase family protein [Xylanibacillus composti]|uniref:CN hydrolase domain-containing protein n=1 Tax=Xylanibacillus composti TaxID=1572762 RepID=A0A8J4H1W5_9BACL|nr:carbon-nitrogen hydrolase family protein [Xylanibacillus composti]MDT9724040.1 carbon-nitrogen hydrolase family protein [Xylanibacillus composti]GIQ69433.1 hypothetical protein XYCOK13_22570 [Xylanibacillus composti]
MTKRFKIAMGQMLVEPGAPGQNLQRAKGMIREAAGQGCHVIVLPECMDLGWTYAEAQSMAQPIPGAYCEELAQAAREHQIHVVAGLTEKAEDRLYNASVLIGPNGQLLAKHRKINELAFAQQLYSIGNSLGVAETPFGTVALTICADNSPSALELGRATARMGAQIVLSPCAWAVPADHDNSREPYGDMWKSSYGTLANEHGMTIVGVSNVGRVKGGEWDGWKCIGCSLAVGPDGVITQGPYGEDAESLMTIELDVPVASGA